MEINIEQESEIAGKAFDEMMKRRKYQYGTEEYATARFFFIDGWLESKGVKL